MVSKAVVKRKLLMFLMLVVLVFAAGGCERSTPSKILFTSIQSGNNREIYVMDADGSNQTKLTDTLVQGEYPCWSPDDNKIAFVSDRDGNHEIYIIDADSSNLTKQTYNLGWDEGPIWQPC
jgi:Tol biopolymer transport system component